MKIPVSKAVRSHHGKPDISMNICLIDLFHTWRYLEHQDKKFIEQGIWMLGWEEADQIAQYNKASEIQKDNRIAMHMTGRSSDYKFRSVNECKMYFFNHYHVLFSSKKRDTECK